VIVHIRTIPPGKYIGYGCTVKTKRQTKVALIPIGYGDGYVRGAQSRRYLLVGGKKAPLIGRVSMDQSCIDITDIRASVGDEVVIVGTQSGLSQSATDLAMQTGTISYEVLTNLSARVTRCYTTSI
jgi:alanine racemase